MDISNPKKQCLKRYKLLSLSLSIIFFFGLTNACPVQAAANSILFFNPTTVSTTVGSDFTVDAMLGPATHSISVAELHITYNQAALQLTSISAGSSFSQTLNGPSIPGNGTAYFAAGIPFGAIINASTTVATLHFHALTTTNNSIISFTTASIVAGDDEPGINELGVRNQALITVTSTSNDITAPTIPTNLQANAVSSSQINLSWNASSDDTGVIGYKIYRNNTYLSSTSNTTYSNTGLSASTLYTYRVSAYDAVNLESAQSTSASATTQASTNSGSAGSGGSESGNIALTTNKILTGTGTTTVVSIATTTPKINTTSTSQEISSSSSSEKINANSSLTDSDGDGIPNVLEMALGTNSLAKDSDNDGFDDKTEILNNFNPSGSGKIVIDKDFSAKQAGKILLQVESQGEAWYINPLDMGRYYLGRPADAFALMRKLSLGATHNTIVQYTRTLYPKNLAGRILLDVEDSGKAYFINPKDRKAYYLGRPADAFEVMRKLGVGIKNLDIKKIAIKF